MPKILILLLIIVAIEFNFIGSSFAYDPKPIDFWFNQDGEAFGILEDGSSFSQTNIVNDFTRLQKFQWEKEFWYISDKGVIFADSDLQALSIYLAI